MRKPLVILRLERCVRRTERKTGCYSFLDRASALTHHGGGSGRTGLALSTENYLLHTVCNPVFCHRIDIQVREGGIKTKH